MGALHPGLQWQRVEQHHASYSTPPDRSEQVGGHRREWTAVGAELAASGLCAYVLDRLSAGIWPTDEVHGGQGGAGCEEHDHRQCHRHQTVGHCTGEETDEEDLDRSRARLDKYLDVKK